MFYRFQSISLVFILLNLFLFSFWLYYKWECFTFIFTLLSVEIQLHFWNWTCILQSCIKPFLVDSSGFSFYKIKLSLNRVLFVFQSRSLSFLYLCALAITNSTNVEEKWWEQDTHVLILILGEKNSFFHN